MKDKTKNKGSGWYAVWRIYSAKNLRQSLYAPFALTAGCFIICAFFTGKDSFELLSFIAGLIVTIVPGILGFTLTGYALLMGFCNSDILNGLKKHKPQGREHSMFQILNSTFAVVLYVLFFTTLLGSFVSIIIKAEIPMCPYIIQYAECYNYLWFFVLVLALFYAINSIKDIVINIFNFGQYVQNHNG